MKRKFHITFLLLFLLPLILLAQLRTDGITVGEMCPNVKIGSIINFSQKTARISDFRGKLLILDFWATWCSPCVAFMHKADSLQKIFGDKLVILPVTYEDEKKVKPFLQKMNKVARLNVPSVVSDSILHVLFPHNMIPHEVWIDSSGKVQAITSAADVTASNISLVLSGKKPELAVKIDEPINSYMGIKQVLTGEKAITINKDLVVMQSNMTKYLPYVGQSDVIGPEIISIRNYSILRMYQLAFGEGKPEFRADNRTILRVRDSSKFEYPRAWRSDKLRWANWRPDNLYSYELHIGDTSLSKRKFQIMQQDLNQYFGISGISGTKTKAKVTCWVLVRTSKKDQLKSTGGSPQLAKDAYSITLRNKKLNDFMGLLQSYFFQLSPMPLLDETGYTGNIDLELIGKMSNMSAMNVALLRYGLKFVQRKRIMEMIIIEEK